MPKVHTTRTWQLLPWVLEPTYQRIFLAVILVSLLVAGLYPFKFFPKNQVFWLRDSTGVILRPHAEIVGSSPLASGNNANSDNSGHGITLELWVASLSEDDDVKDLLSIYVTRTREPFAVEAWGKRLIVGGIFRDTQGHRKFRRVGIENTFAPGARRFVTLTSGPDGTKIYLEGKLEQHTPGLTLEHNNFDGTVLLGQTASARQAWGGCFKGLAFYRDELTPDEVSANVSSWQRGDWTELQKRTRLALYAFDEREGGIVHRRGDLGADLSIPKRLRAVDPVILDVPSRRDFTNVSDLALNILGFIPLGGVLAINLVTGHKWSTLRSAIVTGLAGFGLSLMIELLQVLLPTRHSSLLDLTSNTLGTAIGACLSLVLLSRWKRIVTISRSAFSCAIGWRWER
jgi:VanZ family protein